MFKDKTIRKRVMDVIEKKIDESQTRYNTELIKIDEAYEATVRVAEKDREDNKIKVADQLVNEILGKII